MGHYCEHIWTHIWHVYPISLSMAWNTIIISDPAEIVEFKISKNVIKERNYFDVKCKFDGNPIPSWVIGKSKDKPRTVVEGSTTVDARVQARCEDQGLWECTGRNSLNTKKVTRSGNVTVFCK